MPSLPAELLKVPPQAIDIEADVLGAVMLESEAFEKVSQYLVAECFYDPKHQVIFRAMQSLTKKGMPVDLNTVVFEMKAMGKLDEIGGPFEIVKLQRNVISAAHIETHAKIIFQKYHLRMLIRIANEAAAMAFDPGADNFEVHDFLNSALAGIGEFLSGDMVNINKVMMDTMKMIDKWRRENVNGLTGVSTGFSELNTYTRGWQPGDLIIFAARPSVGKTALALHVALEAARTGVPVAIWSLEMKAAFLSLRLLSNESGVVMDHAQSGCTSDEEIKKLSEAANTLSKLPVWFDENTTITISSLTRKARKLKRQESLGLIVIDYLQLINGETKKNGNREQEISGMSRALKRLAVELQVPIIALSQLSREATKQVNWKYGPPLSALRESGAIEQDADVVCMLWRPEDADIANDPRLKGQRKFRIAKQRNGVLGTIDLFFEDTIQRFDTEDIFKNEIHL